MGSSLFEGRLVRLRSYEPEDAPEMRRQLVDTEISRLKGGIDWPFSLAYVAQHAEEMGRQTWDHDNKSLAIETLAGKLVGDVGVGRASRRNGTFEIEIGLSERSEWGKGYAKEAMLLMLRYMFHELRYQKCNLGVYAFNQRAIGLYNRIGFQEEGRRRRSIFTGGRYYDEVLMGMTREEFEERYPDWLVGPCAPD